MKSVDMAGGSGNRVEQSRLLSPGQWLLACVWVALAVTLIYRRGEELSLDRLVENRLRHHAIPIAMGVLYHGHPHDYTGYRDFGVRFQEEGQIDDVINWARQHTPTTAPGSDFWSGDDRGTADYVIAAFTLFGASSHSLYAFYFVVLSASCALFLIGYWRQSAMTAVLLCALAALYATLSVITAPDFTTPSLTEPRILDLLALVATLHIAFATWSPALTWRWGLALTGQAAVFVFLYHCRSSLGWEAAFAIAVNVASLSRFLIARRGRPASWTMTAGLAASSIALLIGGLAMLTVYRHVAYNPRYFTEWGNRVVWHNAIMGIGLNPAIAAKYRLGISDQLAYEAVIAYRRETHDPRQIEEWTPYQIGGSLGGWNTFNLVEYESAARALYFQIWRTDFGNAVHCYAIDKPRIIYRLFARAIGSGESAGPHFRPFGLVPLILIAPGLLVSAAYGGHLGRAATAGGFLFLFSLVPGLLFYPNMMTATNAFAALGVAIYLLAGAAAQRVVTLVTDRRRSTMPGWSMST